MFGRTKIMKSTGNYSDEIKRLKKAVEEADAVVIRQERDFRPLPDLFITAGV